jgi:phage protein D
MLTPAYKLTLGDRVIDTTAEPRASTVVDMTVHLGLDVPADACTLVFGEVGGFQPVRGDRAVVELGYTDGDDGLTRVLTGSVTVVEPGLEETRVTIHSPAHALLHAYADRTYESKTAGAIVRDLAEAAGVSVARAEDGISFPAYVVDGRRSLWRHMADLAALSGFDLYFDPDGELVFEPFEGGRTVHRFDHARHLLDLEAIQSPARAVAVDAFGEGPGADRGDGSWAWLTKSFEDSRGRAGGTPPGAGPTWLLERPALRTAQGAATAARAAHDTVTRRAFRGRLASLGRPQVLPGDAVRLTETPRDAWNDRFQVRRVRHRLDKRGGFTTQVDFRSL